MLFSIITVNFNNCKDLEKTINSVKRQTFHDYEYIVIDGGSKDESRELIEQNTDIISYWVSERDGGIYNGMNKGVATAKGDFCLFLNSGDTFYSDDVLEKVHSRLDADIVCGDAEVTGSNPHHWTAPDSVDLTFWLRRYSLCHQSVFFRTSVLKERPYDESFRIVADYCSLFYETIVNKRSYKHINVTICNYGCDGVSSDHRKSDKEKIDVIDKFRYLGYIESDELVELAKIYKPETRRYKLALWALKLFSR